MKNIKHFAQRYIDWVIKLGRLRFSLLGFSIIAMLALCTHILLSYLVNGEIHWQSLLYSVIFGLISAPFVIYFFTLLVEKLELSRQDLAKSVQNLQLEIHERKLAEQRLAQASQDKTRLMATISHELRTPLNGIVGLSHILLDTKLTEEQRNYLNTISMSASALGYIFNDIIDLEKIDGRKLELYYRATEFIPFLRNIENLARLMAEQKGLDFELKWRENLPDFLAIDSTRLNQVLWNLLNNAIKFTDQGKVSLTVEQIEPDEYLFSVTDTGQGIAETEIPHIFTMYYQVENNQHKPAGSGIGLAISKNIALLMGGDLTVSSEVGVGSTFQLRIKAEQSHSTLSQQGLAQPLDLDILLVEDVELNILVAKSLLEKLGYQVDVAKTGAQALQKFAERSYDLVLLDIQLPDMTGFDIAKKWRADYQAERIDYLPPLIALTANVMHSKQDYQQNGMDDILRKPINLDDLRSCLANFFGDEIMQEMIVEPNLEIAEQNSSLDIAMLTDLKQMLGADFIRQNVELFEQTMPTYLGELKQSLNAYQNQKLGAKNVAEIAHKIKGAAASIGLQSIQQIAELAQHNETENWQLQIADWVNQLEQGWQANVDLLYQWLGDNG